MQVYCKKMQVLTIKTEKTSNKTKELHKKLDFYEYLISI